MKCIISIPAYNEEKTIGNVIDEIHSIMKTEAFTYKILVLNDGSTDKTVEIAKKHGAIVFSHRKNKGLANTFRQEMKQCLLLEGDVIIHTDADGQYPAQYIPQFIKKIEKGSELVLGSRFTTGSYNGSFMKRIGNIIFAKVFSIMLHMKITDTTTGFRAFTKKVAKLPIINTFTYTQEQLIRARTKKYKIDEIPIHARKIKTMRPSRLFNNSFEYAIKAWINIFRVYKDISPHAFFGRIGIILFGGGFLLGCYITIEYFVMKQNVVFSLILISGLLLILSFQMFLFSFFTTTKKR
jgi:glycosyltransferase involved in cell wall biosynthesis